MKAIESDARKTLYETIDALYDHRRRQEQFVPGRSYLQYAGSVFDQEEIKAILD